MIDNNMKTYIIYKNNDIFVRLSSLHYLHFRAFFFLANIEIYIYMQIIKLISISYNKFD